jgi:hypothetical protein
MIHKLNYKLGFSFLPISKLTLKNQTATLYNSGYVVVSDGLSKDALPITFCSQSLVDKFNKDFE